MWAGGSPAYKTGFGLHAVSRDGMDANSQAAARIFVFRYGWILEEQATGFNLNEVDFIAEWVDFQADLSHLATGFGSRRAGEASSVVEE